MSEIRYRRVELHCGSRLLSEADNWYVPEQLTATINSQLQTSTIPFGTAVRALRPYRRTFAVRILWSPLAAGWELQPLPPEQQDGGQTQALASRPAAAGVACGARTAGRDLKLQDLLLTPPS